MKDIKSWTKWIYWFTFAVAVIFVYKTLDSLNDVYIWIKTLLSILMPFILAILLAYLLYIPCRAVEKLYKKSKVLKKCARHLSVFTVYIIVLLIIILIVNIVFPAISNSLKDLANNLPSYYNKAISYVQEMPEDFIIKKEKAQEVINNLQEIDITKILSMENLADYINGAIGIVSSIFSIFVTIIVSIYILLERKEILGFVKRLNGAIFKEETSNTIYKYFLKSNNIFFKFISAQIIDALVIGTIVSIAMWIMGVKYAILLGLMIGLFNIIPFFGAIVGVGLATIITVFTGGFSQSLWMLLVVIILQQIDANIINPKIIGDALKLSPILVIFSVTVFGAYFGVLGMFLAVPIVSLIKILINDYIEYKAKKRKSIE